MEFNSIVTYLGDHKSDIAQGLVLSVKPSTFDSLAVNMAVLLLQSFTVTVRVTGDLSVTCQEVNDYRAKKRHVRFRSVFKV